MKVSDSIENGRNVWRDISINEVQITKGKSYIFASKTASLCIHPLGDGFAALHSETGLIEGSLRGGLMEVSGNINGIELSLPREFELTEWQAEAAVLNFFLESEPYDK